MFYTSTRVAALERELAVLHERERLVSEHNLRLMTELAALTRKYDRLVEQRLYKQHDISTPITDSPMPSTASPPMHVFGTLGRMDYTPPRAATPVPE